MKGLGRFDESDPEPVLVVIGETGWGRRARCADVLIGEVSGPDCVEENRDVLFSSYPGLSLAGLTMPGLIAIADRSETILWYGDPARLCSYSLDAVAVIAIGIYFQRAVPAGGQGGVRVETGP